MKILRIWMVALVAGFILINCSDNSETAVIEEVINNRSVAIVYMTTANVKCRSKAAIDAPVVMKLTKDSIVDLASTTENAMKADGYFWLRINPRLSQKPASCYARAKDLIPVQ